MPRKSSSNPPGASAPSLSVKDIFIFPDASKSFHPERVTVAGEIFFISIHSAVDESDDPIHAISLRMIARVVDGAGALIGKTHGAMGSVAGVDDAIEDDGEDEVAIAPSLKLPSVTGVNVALDCAFVTLFFAKDGDGAGVCGAAATPASAGALSSSVS